MSMHNGEIVAALDIGTTKIACLVGRKNEHGKVEILGVGTSPSYGVKRGVVHNVTQTVESINEAVHQAELKSNISISKVNVGIAGQHIRSMQHNGVRMRDKFDEEISVSDIKLLIEDMHKLVMLPGEEIIHVLPQEYTIDNESGIQNPVGMFGGRMECNFHIIIGQIASIKNIYRCLKRADLEVNELILEPLASADSVLTDEEREAGVALVDIGGGTTDIAIFHQGIIRHTAVIPFGGDIITKDIQKACSILESQAEKLKVKFGAAIADDSLENQIICIPGVQNRPSKEISLKNLAMVIQARMAEILESVFYEINNSGYGRSLICGMVITGGGAQLKHLKQLAEFTTGLDTRIGQPITHLSNVHDKSVESSMHATGVGLVMKGLEDNVASATKPKDPVKGSGIIEDINKGGLKKILNKVKGFFDDNLFEE